MNRFQLLGNMTTAFDMKGATPKGKLLGVWTKKDGSEAADSSDVTAADMDAAYKKGDKNFGCSGTMVHRQSTGPESDRVRSFQVPYLEFRGDVAVEQSNLMHVFKFGEAGETAFWQKASPTPTVTAPNTVKRVALNAYLTDMVGKTLAAVAPGDVTDFVVERSLQLMNAWDVTLYMSADGTTTKVGAVVRRTNDTAPAFAFEIDKVG